MIFIFLFSILYSFHAWTLVEQKINPQGTYLYVDYFTDTEAKEATSLFLEDIPTQKDSLIELSFHSSNTTLNEILGLFSNSKLEAIAFNEKLISPRSLSTKHSKIPTDIFQDFSISSDKCLALTIPRGADRLLFSLNDSFFSNNKNISVTVKAEKLLFQIKEKTIYQVVNSPKINLKDNSQSFDIAKNKTAVLQVVYELLDDNYSSNRVFKPVLKINSKSYKPKCFDSIKKSETSCDFNLSEFDKKGLLEKTIILPMREKEALDKKGSYQIELGFEDKLCKSDFTSWSFKLNVFETRKLQTAFTLIKSVDVNKWKDFIKKSLLDFNLLKRVYPVADVGSNNPQWIFLNQQFKTDERQNLSSNNNNNSQDESNAIKDNSKGKVIRLSENDFSKSSGLLKDLTELKKMRIKQQLDKLFAVADKNYFSNLGKEHVAGFVVFTDRASDTENVGFIRLDQGGTGTILHEMGHLLGQLNEFYRKSFKDLSANSLCEFEGKKDYCFRFKNFKGFYGSLKESYDKWGFIVRKDSIMNNSSNLEEQWIDRETYGKSLKTLSNPKLDPELLIFSGVFNKTTFIEPELEYLSEGFLTADNPSGDLTIRLLDKNSKELYALKISTKISIEFIDSSLNKPSVTEELVPAPVAVALPYLTEAKKLVIFDEESKNQVYSKELDKNSIIMTSDKTDLTDRIVFE